MVYLSNISNQNFKTNSHVSFGKNKGAKGENEEQKEGAVLLYQEKKKHPITTGLMIQADKLKNAFTTYPAKGLAGSKNANFYEFLTMGTVPYLVGSGMMMAVFNLASKYFDTPAAQSSLKIGKKMGIGVVLYGLAKTFSKKLIETPLNLKYGIDVNVPYKKKIDELPEERNKDNLVAYEYHKAYESVDFPYWDLFYGSPKNKNFGENRNDYFDKVGKKMGFSDEDLKHSDQKVKPRIREKIVQTKAFASLSSFLWAATAVGISMQQPMEKLLINPVQRIKDAKNGIKNTLFIKDFGTKFAQSFKEFVGADKAGLKDVIINKCKNKSLDELKMPLPKQIAGRALFACAIGMTLLGNFFTLTDFNKDRGKNPNASTSLIDESKEKVVC